MTLYVNRVPVKQGELLELLEYAIARFPITKDCAAKLVRGEVTTIEGDLLELLDNNIPIV